MGRNWLYLGVGIAALAAASMPDAFARDDDIKGHSAAAAADSRRNPVLFAADDVTYDDRSGILLARGHVELVQNGRSLMADSVSYNQQTSLVIAAGHVSLEDVTGSIVSGTYVELTDDLRDGFIKDIRILLSDRSRFAANTGRRSGDRTELRRAVYSPCDLCAKDPSHPPMWQIKAERVIRDEGRKIVEYRDAVLEIEGVPILWTPYLSHPDPEVKRQSGFLVPTVGSSSTLGAHATLPYFWVISPDKDFLFEPIIATREGLVLAGRYRERFGNGEISAFGSGTDALDGTDAYGNFTGRTQWRGNIDATGTFDLTDTLRAGFSLDRASDQTYTRVYDFGNWSSFLTSNLYLDDFSGRNFGSIEAYAFQALREGVQNSSQPLVLPVANYDWYGRPNAIGGTFTSNFNFLDILRESGDKTQRLSVGTSYDQPVPLPFGQLLNVLANVRGDSYYTTNAPVTGGAAFNGGIARAFPQLGLKWRYPFFRASTGTSILIEPIVAGFVAPVGENPARLPQNDSQGFDFSDGDLFVPDRLYGYDEVDGGDRADYAIHAAWFGASGGTGDALFGQSYRFQSHTPFLPGSGLDRKFSDFVGRVSYAPADYLDLAYHFRLDHDSLRPTHQEVTATTGPKRFRVTVSFVKLSSDFEDDQTGLTQVGGSARIALTQYWWLTLTTVRNIGGAAAPVNPLFNPTIYGQTTNNSLNNSIGINYTDECFTFALSFTESGVRDRDLRPGDTILFQLIFKNLGAVDLPSIHGGSS